MAKWVYQIFKKNITEWYIQLKWSDKIFYFPVYIYDKIYLGKNAPFSKHVHGPTQFLIDLPKAMIVKDQTVKPKSISK